MNTICDNCSCLNKNQDNEDGCSCNLKFDTDLHWVHKDTKEILEGRYAYPGDRIMEFNLLYLSPNCGLVKVETKDKTITPTTI